jgi:hypothetical protein
VVSIFVSYRRRDTAGHAGRLVDGLRQEFGRDRVFLDIDIPPGVDFTDHIDRTIGAAQVLIVLIGDEWLNVQDQQGRRRLDDPTDFVRSEIRSALQRGLTVIPILVERASMPSVGDLPEDIKRLSHINALELSDSRWDYDVGRLVDHLRAVVAPRSAEVVQERPTARRPAVVVVGVIVLLALVGAGIWIFTAVRDGGDGGGEAGLGACDPGSAGTTLVLEPTSGPAGSTVRVTGSGFDPEREVRISVQAIHLETLQPDADGGFAFDASVPQELGNFSGTTFEVIASQPFTFCEASANFTVS